MLYQFRFSKIGGDEGARTPDPLLAKQVLFQLSYIPSIELTTRPPSQEHRIN